MTAELGTVESWAYGRNWWARGVPVDGRKPKTFGPQLDREKAESMAEDYVRGSTFK